MRVYAPGETSSAVLLLGRYSGEENGGWLSEQEGLFLPFASHARHEEIERNGNLGPKGARQIAEKSSAPRSSLIMIPLLLPVFFLRSTSLSDQGKQQKGEDTTQKTNSKLHSLPILRDGFRTRFKLLSPLLLAHARLLTEIFLVDDVKLAQKLTVSA